MKKKLFSFFAALFLIGLLTVTANASTEDTEITYCSTLEEMGASLRAQLVERRETCTVGMERGADPHGRAERGRLSEIVRQPWRQSGRNDQRVPNDL